MTSVIKIGENILFFFLCLFWTYINMTYIWTCWNLKKRRQKEVESDRGYKWGWWFGSCVNFPENYVGLWHPPLTNSSFKINWKQSQTILFPVLSFLVHIAARFCTTACEQLGHSCLKCLKTRWLWQDIQDEMVLYTYHRSWLGLGEAFPNGGKQIRLGEFWWQWVCLKIEYPWIHELITSLSLWKWHKMSGICWLFDTTITFFGLNIVGYMANLG